MTSDTSLGVASSKTSDASSMEDGGGLFSTRNAASIPPSPLSVRSDSMLTMMKLSLSELRSLRTERVSLMSSGLVFTADSMVDIRLVKPLVIPFRIVLKPALRLSWRLSCMTGPLMLEGSESIAWLAFTLRGRLVKLLERVLVAPCLRVDDDGDDCLPVAAGEC